MHYFGARSCTLGFSQNPHTALPQPKPVQAPMWIFSREGEAASGVSEVNESHSLRTSCGDNNNFRDREVVSMLASWSPTSFHQKAAPFSPALGSWASQGHGPHQSFSSSLLSRRVVKRWGRQRFHSSSPGIKGKNHLQTSCTVYAFLCRSHIDCSYQHATRVPYKSITISFCR